MFRTLLALALIAFFAAGCNTIEGAGKDVSAGGHKVQEEAKEAKQKM